MDRLLAWAALLAAAGCSAPQGSRPALALPLPQHVFYRPRDIGSEVLFDPISSSVQYILDSEQVEGFGTDDYERKFDTVLDHLVDPVRTIENDEGWRSFVNTEVLPIDPQNIGDSKAILPNVALHMLGGGLVYRKNAEWLEAHGSASPYFASAMLAMAAEVLSEAVEKPDTENVDEIADVYVWRPIGIWLFSDHERALWVQKNLDPLAWPAIPMWDVEEEEFTNTGMSYVVRPPWIRTESTRLFSYLGMTNLLGLSHAIGGSDKLSWGVGAATETVDPLELRPSAGLFYDRDDSLLVSVIFNGAENFAVRANVYPGVLLDYRSQLGVFVGVTDDGVGMAGIEWSLPIGLAR